jgi:hypothetical protein
MKVVSGPTLRRKVDRTKRTSFVACAIARPHTSQILSVGLSENHRLLEKKSVLCRLIQAAETTICHVR